MNANHTSILVSAAALFLAAGLTFGQSGKPSDGQDVLKGPKVQESGVPGVNRRFTGGDQKKKDQMGSNIPQPIFTRALNTLKGDSVEESLRLTAAQQKSLDEIERSFKEAQKSYRSEHEAELRSLRDKLPENAQRRLDGVLGGRPQADRPEGGRPAKKGPPPGKTDGNKPMEADRPMDADRPAPDSDAAQALARVRELMEGAPKVEDTQTKMWAVLSAPQKAKVEQTIERLKSEAGGKGREGRPNIDSLPPRLQERLKNMTPEEREEAIKRYKERQKQDK
ncbi:MAG: hypothetical protein JNK25_04095 [Phycisphaerae bacterium]|nr:hypothetical protein [Phycisphaerae bacterium]